MDKIRKNDTVKVIAGRDRGKTGRVLRVLASQNKMLVEGINFVKRHTRRTQQDQQGGIVSKESPISVSNLMLQCKSCNRSTKVGITTLTDGTKARFCKKCKEIL